MARKSDGFLSTFKATGVLSGLRNALATCHALGYPRGFRALVCLKFERADSRNVIRAMPHGEAKRAFFMWLSERHIEIKVFAARKVNLRYALC
jgi:hypothetical protein